MNGPETALLRAVGWTLIHFVWQASAVALLLALATSALERASAQSRYLAGCLAMLLMGLVPAATLRHEIQSVKSGSILSHPIENEPGARPVENPPRTKSAVVLPGASVRTGFASHASWSIAERLIPWIVMAWGTGVFLLSIRLFASWLRVQLWKRSSRESLDDIWINKVAELQRRLGIRKKIALVKASFLEAPAVMGWLRPVILLPASAVSGLSPAQLEAILIHELAHIQRHDYLINLLQRSLETLLFYHPAVWWVSAKIRQERENCCDDVAVKMCGDRIDYARALTTLEDLRHVSPALALAANGPTLTLRIQRILGLQNGQRLGANWLAGTLSVTILVFLFTFSRTANIGSESKPQAAPSVPATNEVSSVVSPVKSLETSDSQIMIEIKWVEVRESNRPTNGLRGFLDRVLGDAVDSTTNHSSLVIKPCLGSALAIQDVEDKHFRTHNNAIKEGRAQSATLDHAEFTSFIQALRGRHDVDLLASPRISTLNGRQAQVSSKELQTIVTGTANLTTTKMEFGPSVDLLPEIWPDRSRVKLRIVGRIREFAGYCKTNADGTFEPVREEEKLGASPKFLETYYETTEDLKVGESIVLGGLTVPNQIRFADKVAVLGDIPVLGRLFRRDGTQMQWKSTVLIVTPTIMNSRGEPQ